MFSKNRNGSAPIEDVVVGHSMISRSAVLSGDIKAESDLMIDGQIEGHIVCNGKIVIGPNGCVKGNIESVSLESMGKIYGDLAISDIVVLKASSYYKGEIVARNIEIESGASFFGNCRMDEKEGNQEANEYIKQELNID